jgi:hypothetical protein
MRSVGNFHPVWGNLAATSSLRHTLLVTVVATAVGGTASAAVVLSLVNYSLTGPGGRSISAEAPANKAEASGVGIAAQIVPTVEHMLPPLRAGMINDGSVAAVSMEARHRGALRIERKVPKHRRVVDSRPKVHWWRFARIFTPFPHSHSW